VRTHARTGTFWSCTRDGLGSTPGKSTSYTSGQGSNSSASTPRELEMAVEMKRLKTLYEAQNVLLQEQNEKLEEQNVQLQKTNNKYAAQQEELATVKQPSIGNNQEGDVLV